MKSRNGFVSNSSSSSFIIAYKPSDACPHCGRSDPDLVLSVADKSGVSCDETGVSHFDAEGVLGEINGNLKSVKERREECLRLCNGDLNNKYVVWGTYETTGTEMFSQLGEQEKLWLGIKEKVEEYVNKGWKIADIDISYHDDEMQELFTQEEKNGTIVVLDRCD